MTKARSADDTYSDQEAQRRFETTLRAAFNTPHKPQAEMKLGKRKPNRAKSPGKRKRRPQKPAP